MRRDSRGAAEGRRTPEDPDRVMPARAADAAGGLGRHTDRPATLGLLKPPKPAERAGYRASSPIWAEARSCSRSAAGSVAVASKVPATTVVATSARRRVVPRTRARRKLGSFVAWASTCTPVAPSQTTKLALCSSARLTQDEQRHTGREEHDSRHHDHRRHEGAQHEMGWPLPGVLVGSQVVAQHAPAGAGELQRHDGDEEHPHKRVHREERPQPEKRCSFDREQQHQERRDQGRQLPVAGASAEGHSREATHRRKPSRGR